MVTSATLAGQNWLITPAVNLPVTSGPPSVLRGEANQLWLLTLTGLGTIQFGGSGTVVQWTWETVRLVPDLQPALLSALTSTSTIVPPGTFAFNLLMWAPFVSISGVTSKDFSIDGGFAINDWRPTPFISDLKDEDGNVVSQVFQGIDADIGVLHTSEVISVSYDITLLGRIVRLRGPINQGAQQTVISAALKKQ